MINLFSPARTVLIYCIFGIVWVFSTDSLLHWLSEYTPSVLNGGQRIKGVVFVLISAALLYWLLQKYLGSLRKSERTYLNIFQANPQPMWIYDLNSFRFIEVNDAAVSVYGYSREEFRHMTILDMRPAEDIERVKQYHHNMTSGYADAGVWRHLKKDGTVVYVDIQAYATEYNGKEVQVVCSRDVSEKYLASKALSEHQQLLSTIINSTDDLVWSVDANLRFVAFNNAFKTIIHLISGVELEVGMPLIDAEGEAEYRRWQQYYEATLRGEKQVIEEERELQDAGITYAEITMDPIMDEGRIIGVACFAHNITERKQQEIQMKKMLERYDMVTLATNDVIWDWDLVSNQVIWNKNLEVQFGHTAVENEAGWWEKNVHPDDVEEVVNGFNQAAENGQRAWAVEYRFRRADGVYRSVNDRGYVMYNEEGKPIRMIGAMQDVEDKKQYIEELKKVAQLSSHSLRRPVASMLGIVSMLNKDNLSHPDNAPLLAHVERVAQEMDGILHVVAEKCNNIFQQTEKV
ncbi:PAS domain S-box protein [Chitinophaga alhagiae]|uniref:PAS domain S-box protein n=1 Tax=Chitinophaga alhagiae TaxID=2203219 RepID=UPI000E5A6B7F|nr:PAS domain S-box protein [Chitinophaga alhagiae]